MVRAWLVHAYTASGALFAFLSLGLVSQSRYRDGFFWLFLSLLVDATDGALARRNEVSSRLPWFDGGKLDDIVDYLTYVFVPAFVVWHARTVPDSVSVIVPAAMLLSSAYGFSREDAKTSDHYFTGFPSYWNIVVFYLFVANWSPVVNATIILVLAVLVFLPIRYLYPSRTPVLRSLTLTLGISWGALMIVMLWQMPAVQPAIFLASLMFPVYYVTLSLMLHMRRGL